ncbi:NACHT domain-containing protein [Streptomyces sp. NPDC057403]|uniref:NACHT domain-containing protein n=1 Tax=Streptomyces sp. NPDC057403 TaxID=3346119 RepID=UPI0036A822A4
MELLSFIVPSLLAALGLVVAYLAWKKPRSAEITRAQRLSLQNGLVDEQDKFLKIIYSQLKYMDFRGLVRLDRLDIRFQLADVVVEPQLRTLQQLTGGLLLTAGRDFEAERLATALSDLVADRRENSITHRVDEIIAPGSSAVILGDPGSGKSTALKLIALRLSSARRSEGRENSRIPLLFPFTAYAEAMRLSDAGATNGIALDDFIVSYFRHTRNASESSAAVITNAISDGRAVFLIDGLDEIISSDDRSFLMSRLEDFMAWQISAGNSFVMTSRIIGYSERPVVVDGLRHFVLADFSDDEIENFVDRWCTVAETAARSGADPLVQPAAEAQAAALKRAVFSNAGVRRLASNPLLLTILVFIHRQGVELPKRRAELYDLYMRVLLNSWARVRNLDGRPIRPIDESEVTKVLAPMAYWVHQSVPSGYCDRDVFVSRIASLYEASRGISHESALERAENLVDVLLRASGLLIERGEGQVAFAHLTFEEYLAARHIVLEGQVDKRKCVRMLEQHIDDPRWREVTSLVVGFFGVVTKEENAAGLIVNRLAYGGGNRHLRNGRLLWAAEAAIDAGDEAVPAAIWNRLKVDINQIARGAYSGDEHWRAGKVLAVFGDPVLQGYSRIPEMITVSGGEFISGAPVEFVRERLAEIDCVDLAEGSEWVRDYWRLTVTSEGPQEVRQVGDFRISRFPVTNEQYSAFLKDRVDVSVPLIGPGKASRFAWDQHLRTPPAGRLNEPVVLVSWDDARAYCQWLSGETGRCFRLPTEDEWEYACRGNTGSMYPWGDGWDNRKANTVEGGIGDIVAVGLYSSGASPFSIEDCVGQVWEWTQSNWGHRWTSPLPRNAGDGEEGVLWKVVRGGSWDDLRAFANSSARGANLHDFRSHYIGFRIVEELDI